MCKEYSTSCMTGHARCGLQIYYNFVYIKKLHVYIIGIFVILVLHGVLIQSLSVTDVFSISVIN